MNKEYDFSSLGESAISANEFLQKIIAFAERLFNLLANTFKTFKFGPGYEKNDELEF